MSKEKIIVKKIPKKKKQLKEESDSEDDNINVSFDIFKKTENNSCNLDTNTIKKNWKLIEVTFLELIKKVNDFDEFMKVMNKLSFNEKGYFFEYFTKLYFEIVFLRYDKYTKFYLYDDIPCKIKENLNLPEKDKGIDCIVNDKNGKTYAIQVKYRSNNEKIIPFGELATFPALAFGTNVKVDGGIFFSNCVDVCNELQNNKYTHVLLNTLDENCDKLFWDNVRESLSGKQLTKYILRYPLKHQQKIIDAVVHHFTHNAKGRLYLPCGSGKTFVAFWTFVRELKYDKIFIVVPSLYLLSQTHDTWIKETQYDKDKYHFLLIGSDMDTKDNILCTFRPTTDEKRISKQILENKKIVVITTYHSSDLLIDACKKNKFRFDVGVYDEAHRTVGEKDKCFTKLINSEIEKKKLFMTATEKVYNYNKSKNSDDEKETILSMDNESVYGKIICKYSMREAIYDNVLVDYQLIAAFVSQNILDNISLDGLVSEKGEQQFNSRIIITGLMVVMSMKKYKFRHMLIFSNINDRAKEIIEFIEYYIKKYEPQMSDIYCKYLSGNDSMNKRKAEVNEFERSNAGIISSARIFGEGVDITTCDSVCFADGKSSSVDIVQYVGRCLRKCSKKPNKLSYVLVPFVLDENEDFFDYDNVSYLKLRKILKTIGTTDDMVTEKFVLMDCNKEVLKNIDKCDEMVKVPNQHEIDMNGFGKEILTKIFDKTGDKIDMARNCLMHENKKRYDKNEDLVDTRKKSIKFLQKKGMDVPNDVKNWIKYCLGDRLFEVVKNKYVYSKDEFLMLCEELNIKGFDEYKVKYLKNTRLPPPDYINDGFYYDLDSKFDVINLIENNVDDYDYF